MRKVIKQRLRPQTSDSTIRLGATPTGQGIPLDQRDKIFNLYFTTKEKGNGIGLAVSAKVLQLMGGGIEFDSTTGQGTTFRLKMPAALPVDATFAGVA